ncbi:hypothetical protein [Streptomyces sp. A30]|uniref:hypothetical protein n=1 Tax=Streptomyces sp. A30 TaxID=2789273 RepID=UPI00397EF0C6
MIGGRGVSWRLRQHGYERARKWRVRKSGWYAPLLLLTFLGALLLLFLMVTAVFTLGGMHREKDPDFDSPMVWIDTQCDESDFSCSVLQSVFIPFLTLALATVAYLFFRFNRVRRAYLKRALEAPHEIVETAGGIFGEVVGRDQLCAVLMEDLRDSRFRRTHVVVGGVGTGKTALVVLLTRQLARYNAVAVRCACGGPRATWTSGSWRSSGSPARYRATSAPVPRGRRCGGGCASRDGSSSSRTGWKRR